MATKKLLIFSVIGQEQKKGEKLTNDVYSDAKKILGISTQGLPDISVLQSSYRKKSLEYHPDKNIGNEDKAREQFAQVQEAYLLLQSVIKRQDDTGPPSPEHVVRIILADVLEYHVDRLAKLKQNESTTMKLTVLKQAAESLRDGNDINEDQWMAIKTHRDMFSKLVNTVLEFFGSHLKNATEKEAAEVLKNFKPK